MKLRCIDWKCACSQIRWLVLAGAAIAAAVSVATAGDRIVDVSGVKQVDSMIIAQAAGNTSHASGRCILSGCSREICAAENVITPCIWRPEFACYKKAVCEVQSDGKCGWTMTAELKACLRNSQSAPFGNNDRGMAPPPPN